MAAGAQKVAIARRVAKREGRKVTQARVAGGGPGLQIELRLADVVVSREDVFIVQLQKQSLAQPVLRPWAECDSVLESPVPASRAIWCAQMRISFTWLLAAVAALGSQI